MITVANFRHGKKDGHLIAESCLADIRVNGIPVLNELLPAAKRIVIHLGTGWYRTKQTVKAYECYLRRNGHADKIADFYIPRSLKLGSKIMFDKMEEDAEYAQLAKAKGYTYGISNAQETYFKKSRHGFVEAMNHLLFYLEDGDLCISIGHNGIIETFAHMLSPEIISDETNLKELEGIIFEADHETKEYDPACTWMWEREI